VERCRGVPPEATAGCRSRDPVNRFSSLLPIWLVPWRLCEPVHECSDCLGPSVAVLCQSHQKCQWRLTGRTDARAPTLG
jgi:hypothetical protein